MKKIFQKSNILSFIVGALLFGCIGTVAAYNLLAKDIKYTPKDSTWNVDNVEDAIDDLNSNVYKKLDTQTTVNASDILNGKTAYNSNGELITGTLNNNQTITIAAHSNSTARSSGELKLSDFKNKYKYFKLTHTTSEGDVNNCVYDAWSSTKSTEVVLALNTQYEIASQSDGNNYISVFARTTSKSNSWSRCWGTFLLYN